MTDKLRVKNQIEIHCSKETLWDLLTQPEHTKKYMFGSETVSDWKTGSTLLWQAGQEGNEVVYVSGYILEISPFHHLKYSVIDPSAPYPKTPENHLNVTYDLESDGLSTILTVTQDGFENVEDSEKRYRDVSNNGEGWNPILEAIKNLAESETVG